MSTGHETSSTESQVSKLLCDLRQSTDLLLARGAEQYFTLGVYASHIRWLTAQVHRAHDAPASSCPDPLCTRTRKVLERPSSVGKLASDSVIVRSTDYVEAPTEEGLIALKMAVEEFYK